MEFNWNNPEVVEILSNNYLSLDEMAEILNRSKYNICRRRKQLGLGRLPKGNYGHISTNKERKARYNAKIKLNGYKPLKTIGI